jgi:tetratricopeptide (TPR) repeat protein
MCNFLSLLNFKIHKAVVITVNGCSTYNLSQMRFLPVLSILWTTAIPFGLAQTSTIDSILLIVQSRDYDDTIKVDQLNNLSVELLEIGEYDSAQVFSERSYELSSQLQYSKGLYYSNVNLGDIDADKGQSGKAITHYNEALEVARSLNDNNKLAACLNSIAIVHTNAGEYNDAMRYLRSSLELRIELKDTIAQANTLNNIGNIHTYRAEYAKAIENYLASLTLCEEVNYPKGVIDAYNNMGVVAWRQGNYDEAQRYFDDCATYARQNGNSKALGNALNNIGNLHYSRLQYDLALDYYNQAAEVRLVIHDYFGLTTSYNNIGVIHEYQNRPDDAIESFLKALNAQKELNDLRGMTASYLNIGSLYAKQSNFDEAIRNTEQGIQLARKLGITEHVKSGFAVLTEIYEKMDNFEKALETWVTYTHIKDSLLNKENYRQIETLKIKYETEKKENENTALKLENEKQLRLNLLLQNEKEMAYLNFQSETAQRRLAESLAKQRADSIAYLNTQSTVQQELIAQEQSLHEKDKLLHQNAIYAKNLLIGIITGAVALLAALTLWFIHSRRNRYQRKLKEVQETALRAQLKPHFVFNAIGAIQSFIKDQPDKAGVYLAKFSHFTQEVLENSDKQRIPLSDELSMIKKYMDLQNLRLMHPFTYDIHISDDIDPEVVRVPPAIFQPLVENSIKHCFAGKESAGDLIIRATVKDGLLVCRVEDACDGGLHEATIAQEEIHGRTSHGLKIVRERLALWSKGKQSNWFLQLVPQSNGMQVLIGIPM